MCFFFFAFFFLLYILIGSECRLKPTPWYVYGDDVACDGVDRILNWRLLGEDFY